MISSSLSLRARSVIRGDVSLNFSPYRECTLVARYYRAILNFDRFDPPRKQSRARLRPASHRTAPHRIAPHRIISHVNCIGKRGYVVHIYPFAVVNIRSLWPEANIFPIGGVIIFSDRICQTIYFPTNYKLISIIRSRLTRVCLSAKFDADTFPRGINL